MRQPLLLVNPAPFIIEYAQAFSISPIVELPGRRRNELVAGVREWASTGKLLATLSYVTFSEEIEVWNIKTSSALERTTMLTTEPEKNLRGGYKMAEQKLGERAA